MQPTAHARTKVIVLVELWLQVGNQFNGIGCAAESCAPGQVGDVVTLDITPDLTEKTSGIDHAQTEAGGYSGIGEVGPNSKVGCLNRCRNAADAAVRIQFEAGWKRATVQRPDSFPMPA